MSGVARPWSFHDWDAESITVVVTVALSLYNALELLLLIFLTFKEWRGLYFISLVVASSGIVPYCVGHLLEYFNLLIFWAAMILSTIGWVTLITGQSLVLYSRLGLILTNEKILKAVRWMIIVDACVFHPLSTAIWYGRQYGGEREAFGHALYYTEKIQMTMFCLQEFIISGLYLWKTVQFLKMIQKKGTRRVMWELFAINVIIILMDIALLAMEYKGLRVMERAFKSLIYSVKLKLEFAILGKLVDLVQSSNRALSNTLADVDSFVDPTISRTNSRPSAPLPPKNEIVPDWVTRLETSHVEHVEHPLDPQPKISRKTPSFVSQSHDSDKIRYD